METIKMTSVLYRRTACALCGSTNAADFEILYPANYSRTDVTTLFSARRLPDGVHSQIVQCKKDGQVRSTPVLATAVLAKLYQESDFTYQSEVENLVETYLKALGDILPHLKQSDKILEIGCGSGFVLSALKKRGFKQVYGVEPSKKAVDLADSTVKNRITINQFTKNIFPTQRFRCIFILQTLDHIPHPQNFLTDCLAVLEPGGYILSYHHNVSSWSAKILKEKSPIFDIEHTYLYSHKTTRFLFEKNGFLVKKIYSPLNTISFFHLIWLTPLPSSIKRMLLTPTTLLERIVKTLSLKIPLGNTCVIAQKPE